MTKVHTVGIICEDKSDFESIREIIKRITGVDNLSFKKRFGNGCSHIKSKGLSWAVELHKQNCDLLVVVHDRDRENFDDLTETLRLIFDSSPFTNQYICIPVEEIEAWFLADPEKLGLIFKLVRPLKPSSNPETIDSPKEWLRTQIRLCSKDKSTYINTSHNLRISKEISIQKILDKSESFKNFHTAITMHTFK